MREPKITPALLAAILLLVTLGQVTADIYLPSLPAITLALNSSPQAIQSTLAIFMFGYGASQLIYGPLSDRFGRRQPILWGIALNAIASFLCMVTPNVEILLLGRLLQGLGVGACNAVGRSVMRDVLSGSLLAKFGSKVSMVGTFVIATAPTLGGYIQNYLNWRANFIFLFLYSISSWIFVFIFLPETKQQFDLKAMQPRIVLKNYFSLLHSKIFIGFTVCNVVSYGGLVAYVTVAPFLFQTVIGLSTIQYGWLSFLVATAIALSAFINHHVIVRKGITTMIFYGICLMIFAGLLMLFFSLLHFITAWAIILPIFLFGIGSGLTFANSLAGAFQPFPHIAGSAGALFGCLQVIGASMASALMTLLHVHNQLPLAIVLSCLGVVALFALKLTYVPANPVNN